MVCGEVKGFKVRSRRETESEEGEESHAIDPKPYDLSMSRMKVG